MGEIDNRFRPRRRRNGLIVKQLDGELLVYDRDRNKAHSLNKTAALIWEHCDGHKTVADLSRLSPDQADKAVLDEQVIWYALKQFSRDHLIDGAGERPSKDRRLSRRELIQRIGAAASIPLVISVAAPSVFAANSCVQTCSIPANCIVLGCQGGCSGGICQPG